MFKALREKPDAVINDAEEKIQQINAVGDSSALPDLEKQKARKHQAQKVLEKIKKMESLAKEVMSVLQCTEEQLQNGYFLEASVMDLLKNLVEHAKKQNLVISINEQPIDWDNISAILEGYDTTNMSWTVVVENKTDISDILAAAAASENVDFLRVELGSSNAEECAEKEAIVQILLNLVTSFFPNAVVKCRNSFDRENSFLGHIFEIDVGSFLSSFLPIIKSKERLSEIQLVNQKSCNTQGPRC